MWVHYEDVYGHQVRRWQYCLSRTINNTQASGSDGDRQPPAPDFSDDECMMVKLSWRVSNQVQATQFYMKALEPSVCDNKYLLNQTRPRCYDQYIS